MIPLIEIKSVPIELQMKTTSPSLKYTSGTVEMEISRSEQGGVDVKSRSIQVRQDSFEPRSAAYRPSIPNVAGQSAVTASSAQAGGGVYEVTSAYADQGQISLSVRLGQYAAAPVGTGTYENGGSDSASSYTPANISPKTGVNVKWEDGAMQIRYNMDKLNFDWKIDKGEFKFTPGDIEITVAQRPSITFKYTGGPLYVPRSADPNYKPVNVEA